MVNQRQECPYILKHYVKFWWKTVNFVDGLTLKIRKRKIRLWLRFWWLIFLLNWFLIVKFIWYAGNTLLNWNFYLNIEFKKFSYGRQDWKNWKLACWLTNRSLRLINLIRLWSTRWIWYYLTYTGQREDIRQSNVKAPTYENNKAITEGGYQASDYAHLPVSQELKELFKSIQRYSPNILDIDSKLKAFIPDYIPAIG